MSYATVLNNLAEKAAMANPPREGDYKGEDGLFYCGKCRSPKQCRLEGMLATIILGGVASGLCKCEAERDKAEKAEERRKQEMIRREYSASERRSYCFSDEFYRRMSFAADEGKSPKAVEAAHYYVDNFERFFAENMGLMFLGGVGTGKTFAACCIANALLDKGYRVWVVTTGNLTRAAGNFSTSEETFSKIRDVDLLVIDDFGTQSSTDHSLSLLFDVIDERYKSKKPLVITSNLTAGDLKNATDIRLKRIYDRVVEMCICPISPVVLAGKSLRDEIAREKHNGRIEGERGISK